MTEWGWWVWHQPISRYANAPSLSAAATRKRACRAGPRSSACTCASAAHMQRCGYASRRGDATSRASGHRPGAGHGPPRQAIGSWWRPSNRIARSALPARRKRQRPPRILHRLWQKRLSVSFDLSRLTTVAAAITRCSTERFQRGWPLAAMRRYSPGASATYDNKRVCLLIFVS